MKKNFLEYSFDVKIIAKSEEEAFEKLDNGEYDDARLYNYSSAYLNEEEDMERLAEEKVEKNANK